MEKRYITENHMEIFHYPGNHLHSFCLSLYLKGGSMYETEENNGISHFLEHIAIRNINFLMKGELYRTLDRMGLMLNACTYKEFIQFEITGAKKHIREAIDIFVKLFEPVSLPASEIHVERKRIKAEIREDDEKNSLSFFSGNLIWKNTSLALPITGKSSGLDKMGKMVLQEAHTSLFSPDNLFFYVTGCVLSEEIEYLMEALKPYDLQPGNRNRSNLAQVPEDFFRRNGKVFIKKSTDTVVRFSFDIDMQKHSQEAYMLLYDILFECENSKIHQELSEKYGYIYSFDSGMEQYGNIGSLYFQYEVRPSRLIESIELVTELFCQLKTGITDELDYVKPVYINNAELILDHASNLNWAQAYEGHILKKESLEPKERGKKYAAVTADHITALARELFTCSNLLVTMKGKPGRRLEQTIERILKKLD